MSWRTIHIKEGESLRLKLDNLEVVKEGRHYKVPLDDIATIILEGYGTSLTTRLLAGLSRYNIVLIVCDNRYLPCGIYTSYGSYHRTAKRTQKQVLWSQNLKNEMWKKIVQQKITNQIAVAALRGVSEDRIKMMIDFNESVLIGDVTNREGQVAKVYFNSLYGLDFRRDDDCIENSAMNFGYTIIRSAIARIVIGQGLMPMLGVFHCNEFNSFNLVDDLMEPFRPLMDSWILTCVLNGDDYLSYEYRLKIIDFINQPIKHNHTKTTVNQVMTKYVISFVKAMENEETSQLITIKLDDFIGV